MAMSGPSSSDDGAMCDINTTPLIDVMLVLLIMFIITIPVMTHAVKLDMPRPTDAPPPPVRPEVIDIEIDFDGTVLWNGTPVTVDALEGYFRTSRRRIRSPSCTCVPTSVRATTSWPRCSRRRSGTA